MAQPDPSALAAAKKLIKLTRQINRLGPGPEQAAKKQKLIRLMQQRLQGKVK